MTAVILAAGLGTRMNDLTEDTPKVLLKVRGTTLIEHKLRNLPEGLEEVIIVVGFLGDRVRAALGDSFNSKKITYVEQEELKGTGHALSLCAPLLQGRFLVLMGDDLYLKEDLAELVKYPFAVLAYELPDASGGARWAELTRGKRGELLDILENQPARKGMLVNTGAYVLDRSFFEYPLQPKSPGSKEFGLPQTMIQLVRAGKEIKILKATWWKNITEPADLE